MCHAGRLRLQRSRTATAWPSTLRASARSPVCFFTPCAPHCAAAPQPWSSGGAHPQVSLRSTCGYSNGAAPQPSPEQSRGKTSAGHGCAIADLGRFAASIAYPLGEQSLNRKFLCQSSSWSLEPVSLPNEKLRFFLIMSGSFADTGTME